jgi:hypothetical protein
MLPLGHDLTTIQRKTRNKIPYFVMKIIVVSHATFQPRMDIYDGGLLRL